MKGYYPDMKASANRLKIEDVFEIRLTQLTWQQIRQNAIKQRLSYSWIVRLCLFKLQTEASVRDSEIELLHQKLKAAYGTNQQKLHRHQLCLYGSDGAYLRLLAHSLGFTISQLVRIAIAKYLDQVITELAQGYDVVKQGTKIFRKISNLKQAVMKFHNKQLYFEHFLETSYWPYVPLIDYRRLVPW